MAERGLGATGIPQLEVNAETNSLIDAAWCHYALSWAQIKHD